ncbi:hypothetical protein C922_04442 [Plasmodium inui San Antonio 1]|uniref:Uncharacterized protein n=1 Tax=Plasmodium inui San Antonio 1 TaxID=1237626 RepID=W7AIN1_9APIC|nr:hypothetical protein C922_04442 [Plasmodium inui San Antonio 1]EUD65156.1 hypothetical protein C922_04442 [Plasmodium inui San Antonio 1]
MGSPRMLKEPSRQGISNVEFMGDNRVEELISKISVNYEECTKYDAYMEQDDADEEEDEAQEKENTGVGELLLNVKASRRTEMASSEKLGKDENANSNRSANGEAHKGCNNAVMDNLRDFIFKKKMIHDRRSGKEASFGKPGKNVFTNLNVRKKRIMESSDESDENSHSVKKIIDYVKKKKKQGKG